MLEKEIKILLTKGQYDKIESLFPWEKSFTQINFYYGDLDKVEENGELTVRVRQKEDGYKLQIKRPIEYKNSLHIKEEYERRVTNLPDKISSELLKDILDMDLPDFDMLGKLETLRKIYHPCVDVEISLDISNYFEKTDYEVEIEFGQEKPNEVLSVLRDNGIVPQNKIDGKFARFMSEYLNIKHGQN